MANNRITVKYYNGSHVEQEAGTPLQLTAAPLNNLLRIAAISHHCHLLSTRHKLNIADVESGDGDTEDCVPKPTYSILVCFIV